MKSLKAILNKVVIKLNPREEESAGGIFIPQLSRDIPTEGVVMSAGHLVEHVEVGDTVGVSKHVGTQICVGGVECVIVEDSKLLYVRP